MKFKVELTADAQKEYNELETEIKNFLKKDYNIIETKGIEHVFVKALENNMFEIKTNNIRSIFKYKENRIVIIGLIFKKTTKKTPQRIKKIAKKRLNNY